LLGKYLADKNNRFQGAKLINSLAVYPVKFNTSFEALKESLVSRGTRYLELTSLPYMHKMLAGMTLDEPAEEVILPHTSIPRV